MGVLLKGIGDLDELRLAPRTADDLHADRYADGCVLIRGKACGNRNGGESGGGAKHAVALLLVYSVGMIGSAGSANRLVLAGMAVRVILTAATQFFISIAPDTYTVRNITSWTMGSLTSARWNNIATPFCGSILGSLFFMFVARAYNLLSQGDETATSLGVDVRRVKRMTII